MKLHHIGLATADMGATKEYLSAFFKIVTVSDTVYDKNQDARLCMLTTEDGTQIELVEGEIVRNYIKKRNFMYHTCYLVKNMEKAIEKLY